MPLTEFAYFDDGAADPDDTSVGDRRNHPRCTWRPSDVDIERLGLFKYGLFECALPAGHDDPGGKFKDHPQIREHSLVQVGEV